MLGVVVFIIFATLGGVISWWLSLPLPAGIVGMLMLFIALLVGGHLPNWLLRASQKLSPYLTLFIVPASTGIITQSSILNDYGWQLIGILLVSLVPGALVSALVMGWGRRDS